MTGASATIGRQNPQLHGRSRQRSSPLRLRAEHHHHRMRLLCVLASVWCIGVSAAAAATTVNGDRRRPGYASHDAAVHETVESLVRQWAPMVWLAPGEQFMPGNVNDFLRHVHAEKSATEAASVLQQTADILDVSDDVLLYELDREIGNSEHQQQQQQQREQREPPKLNTPAKPTAERMMIDLPIGKRSFDWFLTVNGDVDAQLEDATSFLYGQDPNGGQVPIYAVVQMCGETAPPRSDAFSENDIDSHDRTARTSYIPINFGIAPAARSPSIPRFSQHKSPRNATTGSRRSRRTKRADSETLQLGSSFVINATTTSTTTSTVSTPPAPANLSRTSTSPPIERGIPQFHVTYWMFYPYNQGKTICTLNLGPLGRLPIPQLFGKCLGTRRDFGSHVGDWEHMTLAFRAGRRRTPTEMYVSAHDAGAYYTYEPLTGSFDFRRQETRQHHLLQQPVFPQTVRTTADAGGGGGVGHPVLFSARGSHGLWTAPGRHRFVRVPRLVDVNGFGVPWRTWRNVAVSYDWRSTMTTKRSGQQQQQRRRDGRQQKAAAVGIDGPEWLQYMGRWGNAKSKCHPLKRLGLNFCEYNDGPTGIPLKEAHFVCKR